MLVRATETPKQWFPNFNVHLNPPESMGTHGQTPPSEILVQQVWAACGNVTSIKFSGNADAEGSHFENLKDFCAYLPGEGNEVMPVLGGVEGPFGPQRSQI